MRMIKYVLIPFILLIILLFGLLFTRPGNQLAIKIINQIPLPLTLELVEGSLVPQAHWKSIKWEGQLFQFEVNDLNYDLDLECLFDAELCVERLSAEHVFFNMDLSETSEAPTESSSAEPEVEQLDIPLLISVSGAELKNIYVKVGNTLVTADLLSTRVDLQGREINVERLNTETVVVKVLTEQYQLSEQSNDEAGSEGRTPAVPSTITARQATETALSSPVEAEGEYALAQVDIPLRVNADNVSLTNSMLQVNELLLNFSQIDLVGYIDGGEVEISSLSVNMPEGDSQLTGQILLQRDYPLTAKVTARLQQPTLLNNLAVNADLSGSIEAMQLDLRTEQLFSTWVQANVEWLEANIPFNLSANWQALSWPLIGEPDLVSPQGKVTMRGDLENYRLDLNGDLRIEKAPPLSITAKGKGDLDSLNLTAIKALTLDGKVNGRAKLFWKKDFRVTSKLKADNLKLARYWPQLDLITSGQLGVNFRLKEDRWKAELSKIDLKAEIEQQTVDVKGDLSLDSELHWRVRDLLVKNGADEIRLNGYVSREFKLGGQIQLASIQPYLGRAAGSVLGYFSLTGPYGAPWLDFDLFSDDLAIDQNSVSRLDAEGRIKLDKMLLGKMNISASEILVAGTPVNTAKLVYKADRLTNHLQLKAANANNKGLITVKGGWNVDGWRGKITQGRVDTLFGTWLVEKGAELYYLERGQRYGIGQHCWNEATASLCLGSEGQLGKNNQFDLALKNFDIHTFQLLRHDDLEVEGKLNARSQITWSDEKPMLVDTELVIKKGSILVYNNDQTTTATFEKFEVSADLDLTKLVTKVDVASEELGSFTGNIIITDIMTQRYLWGDLDIIDIDISFLEPLINDVDTLNGIISGRGQLSGTLAKPELLGLFRLDNGYLEGSDMPVTLDSFSLDINALGQQVDLFGDAKAGDGTIKLTGNVDWQNRFNYSLLLKGERVEFDDDKGQRLDLSPNIAIKGDPKGVNIDGKIDIPYARIKVENLPQNAIQVSKDVIILDAETVPVSSKYPVNLNLDVNLLDNVKIDSFGLESEIVGSVKVVLDEQRTPFADGSLQFEKGRYRSFGQDLFIRKGQIIFSGPIDNPYLNVEAIRNPDLTDDNVIVGVRLTGSVTRPVFSIFSEPEMSQSESISYLLRGRPINAEDESSQDVMITTMLVGSGLGQGEGLVTVLGDTLGVRDFAIDTTGRGDDTRIEVSGYVLPGVQIRYGIGLFNSLSEVAIRYEFFPKFYIEIITGIDNAVDLYYKFSN